MRLSPAITSGRNFWMTQGSRNVVENRSNSEPKLTSRGSILNTAAPPCAVERLHHDGVDGVRGTPRFPRGRARSASAASVRETPSRTSFPGASRTERRIVDDQRLRLQPFQKMGRRDVGEVERRVLSQQHDVELAKVHAPGFAERGVDALLVFDREGCTGAKSLAPSATGVRACSRAARVHAPAPRAAARTWNLRRFDPIDRIHLNGDGQFHWRVCS